MPKHDPRLDSLIFTDEFKRQFDEAFKKEKSAAFLQQEQMNALYAEQLSRLSKLQTIMQRQHEPYSATTSKIAEKYAGDIIDAEFEFIPDEQTR